MMFEHIPYGSAPQGKSKYLFTDHPKMWKDRNTVQSAEVYYTCNKDGYREREWNEINWNNFILFLGDSFTFGLGVRQRETIPFYVENKTNICCVNLSIPGASLELLTQLSLIIKEKADPTAVVLQYPHEKRLYDPITATYHGNLGRWIETWPDMVPIESRDLYNVWASNSIRATTKINFYSNILRHIWKDNCYLEWTSYDGVSSQLEIPTFDSNFCNKSDLARDGFHLGKRKNKQIAYQIVNYLEKKNKCI